MTDHPCGDPLDRLDRVMRTGTTCLRWLWSLGIAWLTILIAGAVVVLRGTR